MQQSKIMKIANITKNILLLSFKDNNNVMRLHRWGNHTSPNSDYYQRMESCMAMKWNDYHNVSSINEKIVDKTPKKTKDKLMDVSDPNVVMMRMTMMF